MPEKNAMKTLKELRLSIGLSYEELSNKLGVSTSVIKDIEKDSSNIEDKLLFKYLIAFDIKYDDVFLGAEY